MENNTQLSIAEIVCDAVLNNHAVKKAGKVEKVEPSMLLDDLKIDSLEKLALAMDFEDHFSIDISDEEIEGFITVGDFITFLDEAVSESADDSTEPTAAELGEMPAVELE